MIGDTSDMRARLRALLPTRWFADEAPVLDALLAGLAEAWAVLHAQIGFARRQLRIATAEGVWLEMMARDFLGARCRRRWAEDDAAFSARLRAELLRERGTRAALSSVLTDLTGRIPVIFEPARAADTGGWGSLALPFQCFVTAYRPAGSGIAAVSGWGAAGGGYGGGAIEYGALEMIAGRVTDADSRSAASPTDRVQADP